MRCCSARVSRILLVLGVTIAGTTLAAAQETTVRTAAREKVTAPAYTIGPGDVLHITVWKEPDLTLDVTVRFDGMVTVPLLGDQQAAGRLPAELAESLAKGLARFVEAPRVTVSVIQANSARFYVMGQVVKPGEFPLSSHTTLLQALALAGGFKEFAKADSIVIVRADQTVVPVNYKRIADGKDASQNVGLGPGDTVVVP
jgi:polysaccharide export outer membrane protein